MALISRFRRRVFGVAVTNAQARSADGQRVTNPCGPAKVLDGDTVIVAGERIRLHGIDAPEHDQPFWWNGQRMNGGALSLAAIEALTAGVDISCTGIERDRYGRLVAKCFSPDGSDICRQLVASGWALAYRQYAMDYVDAETEARAARRGLWRGTFHYPWTWRASEAAAQTVTPVRFGRRSLRG